MESRDLERIRFVTRHFNDLQGLRYAVPLGLIALGAGGLLHFANRPLAFLPAVLFLPALGLPLWARRHYRRAYGEVEAQASDSVPVAIFSPAGPISRLEDFDPVAPVVRHVSVTMGLAGFIFVLFHLIHPHILIRGDETLGQHPHILTELEAGEGYWGGCSLTAPSSVRAVAGRTLYALFGSFFLGIWRWRERHRSQSHHLVLAVLLLGLSALSTALGYFVPVNGSIAWNLDVLLPVLVYPGVALLLCGAAMVLTGLLDHRQLTEALGRPVARQETGG